MSWISQYISMSRSVSLFVQMGLALGISYCVLEVSWLSEADGIRTIGILALLIVSLSWVALKWRLLLAENLLSLGFLILWILLVTTVGMTRTGTAQSAAEGNFSNAAFGEAIVWLTCSFPLILLAFFRPKFLQCLFWKSHRWLSIYTIVVIFSVIYAPVKLYALAWGFKLMLVGISLALCVYEIRNYSDIIRFVRIMHSAFLIVAAAPFFLVFIDPYTIFDGGRLGGLFFGGPAVSSAGGALVLLSIILGQLLPRSIYFKITGLIGLCILLLGVGKTAILSTIIASMAFYFALGRLRSGVAFLFGISLLAGLGVLSNLPIVEYIAHYDGTDQAQSLTGRTELWQQGLARISERPFVGHGYLASKTSLFKIPGLLWEPDSMHNAFLEVLYNNGLLGLIPILCLLGAFKQNVLSVLKQPGREEIRFIAAGLLAILIFVLGTGMTASILGGRIGTISILFLSAFAMSERLRTINHNYESSGN